jgi:hypothetical protein
MMMNWMKMNWLDNLREDIKKRKMFSMKFRKNTSENSRDIDN